MPMKRFTLSTLFLLLFCCVLSAKLVVTDLKVEGMTDPIGLDNTNPLFSWILHSDERGVMQSAYEIEVFENAECSGSPLWMSGKVVSDQSISVPYGGPSLQPSSRYYWRVKVWDNKHQSATSEVALWQTGLMNPANWKAQWIETSDNNPDETRCPYFRSEFEVGKAIKSATAYLTSRGVYEAYLNDNRIGDAYFTPGWTNYNKRLQYQAYDVTNLLQDGPNIIGAVVGNGWYKGRLASVKGKNIYGDRLGLLCQLEILYEDGSKDIVITDSDWKSSFGPIMLSEIYDGETYDACKVLQGWLGVDYDTTNWLSVKQANYSFDNLIATYNQPVKQHEVFTTDSVITTPKGEMVLDFGQNLVGWERIRLKGNKGDTVRIYHAEVLDKDGNFYTANLRGAKSTITSILSGGEGLFEPHFTFSGLSFLKFDGIEDINPDDVEVIALYSDMPHAGDFYCSHPLVNQLQKNIEWGQKSNFLDVPTDCPQRDERLGWTGDAQAFFRTAAYNRDVRNFFKKWMKDVASEQYPDGKITHVVPNTFDEGSAAATGWADVATIIPWQLYMAYGDESILVDQYDSMKRWVDFMANNAPSYLWNTREYHFGDWLSYAPQGGEEGVAAITDIHLIAQCFFAHSTQLLINAAQVLGKQADVDYYADLLGNVKDAFVKAYVGKDGKLLSDTQTAYVLALHFDMLPAELRGQTVDRLVDNINSYGHITTGFLGTPYICHVLSDNGRSDMAYQLLLREDYPSWLYPVKAGATTIWERWDGRKPNGAFQTDEMNSFNHYAYGAIGDWLYREVAGLKEASPGFKNIIIRPRIAEGLTFASATQQTSYGEASSTWGLLEDRCLQQITVPANTTALVYLPTSEYSSIKEGNKKLDASSDIEIVGQEDGYVVLKVGSGEYFFDSLYAEEVK